MTSPTASVRYYRVLRTALLLSCSVSLVLSLLINPGMEVPFSAIILFYIPLLTPFIYRALFTVEKPFHLNLYVAAVAIFLMLTGMVHPILCIMGTVNLVIVGVSSFLIWGVTESIDPIKHEVDAERKGSHQPVSIKRADNMERMLHNRVEEAEQAQRLYMRKTQHTQQQQRKAEEYLAELQKSLNNPMLSAANRETTFPLIESLTANIEQYDLLRKFFYKVATHFQREKYNLEHRLKNMEIMDFLNKQDAQKDLAEVEGTQLQLDFQRELERIEAKLPELDAKMAAQGQLLSADLRAELDAAIKRMAV